MKRFLGLLVFGFLFNSCDDGNLILEDINFDAVTASSCEVNNIIYKIKDKESLILDIPKESFLNETNYSELSIGGINRVLYRFYNGKVEANNICETIPPASPTVADQWTATAGIIQINTTPIRVAGTAVGSTKITGYNHFINFKNITFLKSSGTQVYENFPFGDYITTATVLPLLFDTSLEKCSGNSIYNYNSSEALSLDIDATLLSTTNLGTVKKGTLGTTKNKLIYRLYNNGVLTPSYFCNTVVPILPTVKEEWYGVDGITDASGIVEVTTTTNGPNSFKHTIVLKKVKLKKGKDDFQLGDSFLYGDLLTTN